MNVILLGPPGVGKGTVAKKLSERYKMPHISTGDVLRKNIAEQTELGLKAKEFVDSGTLVPDELVTKMVKSSISTLSTGFFLDGYPRNLAQAKALKTFSEIHRVLNFSASEEIIIERLSGRRTCKECNAIYHVKNIPPKKENVCDNCGSQLYQRSDETPEIIKERLNVYENETKPLIDFYRAENSLSDIDATQNVEGIVAQCVEILGASD
ncbi:adenylate kinase [Candidatus Woesearchaeota archaeon]|nr:adenylate kinase [Candidatus Woesearchaeota archaeon]